MPALGGDMSGAPAPRRFGGLAPCLDEGFSAACGEALQPCMLTCWFAVLAFPASCVQPISADNFGLLIAYLLPGFVALWGPVPSFPRSLRGSRLPPRMRDRR